ncbi:MAG: GAF domain-containing protein [Bacteroidia bacterium]|jgi:signal transduction histidine kinase/CheY-like chemotaxis protein
MVSDDFKPRILYVDDEEENLLVFKASFRKNYHVITATNSDQGRILLEESPVDIVISDQRMPGTSGVEFLNSLPDNPENLRMILTGYSDMEAIVDALNTGKVYKYITKPWDKPGLQKVLDDALNHLNQIRKQKSEAEYIREEKKVIETLIQSGESKIENGSNQLEFIRYKNELELMKQQIDESDKNVRLLSEIGQEIISNRTVDAIVESTYENVNSLMDANSFGVGIYNDDKQLIEFNGWIEKGEKLPYHTVALTEINRPAIKSFKNREEIIINDFQMDAMAGEAPKSILYLPLITNEQVIGVISTQSFSKNAYSTYHLNILRNIAIYVATAIENAKAYSLIEEQKAEIEQKNIELENKVQKRTEELRQMNEEVLKQKDELEVTYRNVKLLSEIGQQITSTLSLDKIIETVYENVNALMDATVFSIGVFNPEKNAIEINGAIEKGEKLPFFIWKLEDETRPAIWCFKNQKEVIINDFQQEYNKYIKSVAKPVAGQDAESIIYLPLISNDKAIGTISVQSFKKHSYNHYHIDILRSLATYATIAIENSNTYGKMTKAFEDLKTAQMKLVESEKMASLGVLTAGVAHEINNPVNFISAGIETLINSYAEIKTLLELYLQTDPEKINPVLWDEIKKRCDELEPEESLPEVEQLLASIKTGATRTAEIVKGLRNFTRLDENDLKKANVHEGIDNTLVILNNRIKNRISIVKTYADIPEIHCYPGQLNQVFMNLLHNASDAIEGEGTIHIVTTNENGNIKISIRDSGKGMTEEIRSRIFEPFYTTKAVGKGTGLGLSIAYGIIEKHKGMIEVNSAVGKGTEFIITLPVTNN